jgi:hypothetical protein
MFLQLKRRLFLLAPVVTLSFFVFAWAANPPKEDSAEKLPELLNVELQAGDAPALRRALSASECVAQKIPLIVLREHRSGSQDAVTVPTDHCAPIRLRLDHGRLAPGW